MVYTRYIHHDGYTMMYHIHWSASGSRAESWYTSSGILYTWYLAVQDGMYLYEPVRTLLAKCCTGLCWPHKRHWQAAAALPGIAPLVPETASTVTLVCHVFASTIVLWVSLGAGWRQLDGRQVFLSHSVTGNNVEPSHTLTFVVCHFNNPCEKPQNGTYWYVLPPVIPQARSVRTGMYWYVLPCHCHLHGTVEGGTRWYKVVQPASGTPRRYIDCIYHVYSMYMYCRGICLAYTTYIQWISKFHFHVLCVIQCCIPMTWLR
jgi:hypothetical protein